MFNKRCMALTKEEIRRRDAEKHRERYHAIKQTQSQNNDLLTIKELLEESNNKLIEKLALLLEPIIHEKNREKDVNNNLEKTRDNLEKLNENNNSNLLINKELTTNNLEKTREKDINNKLEKNRETLENLAVEEEDPDAYIFYNEEQIYALVGYYPPQKIDGKMVYRKLTDPPFEKVLTDNKEEVNEEWWDVLPVLEQV